MTPTSPSESRCGECDAELFRVRPTETTAEEIRRFAAGPHLFQGVGERAWEAQVA